MLINVNFTIETKTEEDVVRLMNLAECKNKLDARLFVKGEAQEYLMYYLEANGVWCNIVRDACRHTGIPVRKCTCQANPSVMDIATCPRHKEQYG